MAEVTIPICPDDHYLHNTRAIWGLGQMETAQNLEEAVEVLQQLGLKEYEARCNVGLTRLH